MRKQIIGIIIGIFFISLTSAMYAGECLEVDLSNMTSLDNVVYDVVGNSSNLEGLTIDLDGVIASICTVPNYKPDNFTIIFIDNSTKEIVKEVPEDCPSCKRKYRDRDVIVEKEVDKIVYVDCVEEPIDLILDEKSNWKYIIAGLIVGIVLLTILIVLIVLNYEPKKKKEVKNNGKNHIEERG